MSGITVFDLIKRLKADGVPDAVELSAGLFWAELYSANRARSGTALDLAQLLNYIDLIRNKLKLALEELNEDDPGNHALLIVNYGPLGLLREATVEAGFPTDLGWAFEATMTVTKTSVVSVSGGFQEKIWPPAD